MQKSYCDMIFADKSKSSVVRKQREKCIIKFPKIFSNDNFIYATKEEAVHSRGKKKGKLKKGYRYMGNGYIVKTSDKLQKYLKKYTQEDLQKINKYGLRYFYSQYK
jgi:hypothetical protein